MSSQGSLTEGDREAEKSAPGTEQPNQDRLPAATDGFERWKRQGNRFCPGALPTFDCSPVGPVLNLTLT